VNRALVTRVTANAAIVAGLFVLAYTLCSAMSGSLALRVFTGAQRPWIYSVYALGLMLPVPFHVISIGLVLKRKWLPPFWARTAWPAIFFSGCWLGAAIAVKSLVI